jgi:hypothetical protein
MKFGDNFRMVMEIYVTSDEAHTTVVVRTPPMPRTTDIGPPIDELYERQMATMIGFLNGQYGVLDFRPMSHQETEAYLWGTHPHNQDFVNENSNLRH